MELFLQGLYAFGGSFGFAILYNIKGKNLLLSTLGGVLGWVIYVALRPLIGDDIIRYFIASMAICLYAQKMAQLRKCPVVVFLVIAVIPLVPGYAAYKTMEALLRSDMTQFMTEALYTFKVVMAMATGFLATSNLIRPMKKLKQ